MLERQENSSRKESKGIRTRKSRGHQTSRQIPHEMNGFNKTLVDDSINECLNKTAFRDERKESSRVPRLEIDDHGYSDKSISNTKKNVNRNCKLNRFTIQDAV